MEVLKEDLKNKEDKINGIINSLRIYLEQIKNRKYMMEKGEEYYEISIFRITK